MTGAGQDLLSPGSPRAAGVADDPAVVSAMVRVEVAWLMALAEIGALDPDDGKATAEAVQGWEPDITALVAAAEASGNPVVPLVAALREAVADEEHARLVHRGLTSQDVLDTAMILVARDALARVSADLTASARELARLAERHRHTLMAGRTLTQWAVPITFGLKAAQWLSGVLDALERLRETEAALPVQCGGAAGTLSLAAALSGDPVAAAAAMAEELGLVWPGLPWHTTRTPVTRIGDALVGACDAMGVLAGDVATLSRPEVGEVREGAVPGRGRSSTMPHKRNPVLSILVRSAALQAPLLAAQLHVAAALAVDERPDGAWHSEWPALRRLLSLSVTAASQTSELLRGLEVDADAMRERVEAAAAELLAERGGHGEPGDYLGAASRFIDTVLARVPTDGTGHA